MERNNYGIILAALLFVLTATNVGANSADLPQQQLRKEHKSIIHDLHLFDFFGDETDPLKHKANISISTVEKKPLPWWYRLNGDKRFTLFDGKFFNGTLVKSNTTGIFGRLKVVNATRKHLLFDKERGSDIATLDTTRS